MSIALLNQVFDETRRLAIAGSSVACDDFRLKKLLPSLEQAGTKSPVFAKLAQSVSNLTASDEKAAPTALLELGTLITSILYTQGETGIEGDLEPLSSTDFGIGSTNIPAKLLRPLLDALTTKGPGRLETITTAFEQGLFRDVRLIRPALLALDDPYSEIADFVANHVLPIYGPALLSELEAQFNPKGQAGQPRRLVLMHQLDPARAQPSVRAALEEGNSDMRIAAIECLGDSPSDLPFLLEQLKSKSKALRRAALRSLARMKLKDADEILVAQIDSNDLSQAIEALRASESSAVVTHLVDRVRDQTKELLSPKRKAKADVGKQLERLQHLLSCLEGRSDPVTEGVHLDLLKDVTGIRAIKGTPSGEDIACTVARNLARGSDRMKRMLCQEHASFGKDVIGDAFFAACEVWDPEAVFKEFSRYLTASHPSSNKKKIDDDARKGEVIHHLLSARYHHRNSDRSFRSLDLTKVSKKWLDLAIDLGIGNIVNQLATLDPKKAQGPMMDSFKNLMNSKITSMDFRELDEVLQAMIRVEHPGRVDAMLELISKVSSAPTYHSHWLLRHLASLPPHEALPKLEALLPSLADPVANQVIDWMVTLRQSMVAS